MLKISNENKDIYVCGDFNTDLLKIEISNNYKKFYDLMFSYGLLPNILLPTRVQGDSATIIDNIFTNNTHKVFTSGNIITLTLLIIIPNLSLFKIKKCTTNHLHYTEETINIFLKIVFGMMFQSKISTIILKTLMINFTISISNYRAAWIDMLP